MLLALRPQDGVRAGWIATPSRDGDTAPAWYKCLLPPQAAAAFCEVASGNSLNLAPAVGADVSQVFLLHAVGPGPGGRRYLALTFDAQGNIRARPPSAEYGQHAGPGSALPDPESLYLDELPPIIPGGEAFRPANR